MFNRYDAWVRSFLLDRERDREFFSYIDDLYDSEEFQSMHQYIQHGEIDRVQHIMSVTYLSYLGAKERGADVRQTLRGAILHDLFYYDWHVAGDGTHRLHGYRHPGFALKNAKKLNPDITEIEQNVIKRHMWPLTPTPPKYKEGLIVSMADKYCAAQEVLIDRFASQKAKFREALAKEKKELGI